MLYRSAYISVYRGRFFDLCRKFGKQLHWTIYTHTIHTQTIHTHIQKNTDTCYQRIYTQTCTNRFSNYGWSLLRPPKFQWINQPYCFFLFRFFFIHMMYSPSTPLMKRQKVHANLAPSWFARNNTALCSKLWLVGWLAALQQSDTATQQLHQIQMSLSMAQMNRLGGHPISDVQNKKCAYRLRQYTQHRTPNK